MVETMRVWLVTNEKSGSNDPARLDSLRRSFAANGLDMVGETHFPAEMPPPPAALDQKAVDIVAIFAGDGTLNAVISDLAGWGGAVLALPGGTMNLLYHRLFGDLVTDEAIRRAAAGSLVRRRPGTISCAAGIGYAGLLAGPATAWYDVREALRDADFARLAESAERALEESFHGEYVRCEAPALGRREGYPMLVLGPRDDGIEVTAYHAENAAEVLEQVAAILRRNFRSGPHDRLGHVAALRMASVRGDPFGILLDGEEAQAGPVEDFTLVPAPVDLLASVTYD